MCAPIKEKLGSSEADDVRDNGGLIWERNRCWEAVKMAVIWVGGFGVPAVSPSFFSKVAKHHNVKHVWSS